MPQRGSHTEKKLCSSPHTPHSSKQKPNRKVKTRSFLYRERASFVRSFVRLCAFVWEVKGWSDLKMMKRKRDLASLVSFVRTFCALLWFFCFCVWISSSRRKTSSSARESRVKRRARKLDRSIDRSVVIIRCRRSFSGISATDLWFCFPSFTTWTQKQREIKPSDVFFPLTAREPRLVHAVGANDGNVVDERSDFDFFFLFVQTPGVYRVF